MRTVSLVVPGNVRTAISGGNIYDRRLGRAMAETGVRVGMSAIRGSWPLAGAAGAAELEQWLRRAPEGASIIIDGIVAAPCPDVIARAAAGGADVHILVHMPLALDPVLSPATATALNRCEHDSLHAAAGVIATSAWSAAELRRRHGLDHITVAVPGIDPAAAAHGSTPPCILQVGAVSSLKNQLALVEALAGISSPWTARLIGTTDREPGYAARVRRAIAAAGLTARITLTGELTGPALDAQWQAADISVLPSLTETYGMVVAEALARAVPVVVAAATGAEEALGHDGAGHRPGFVIDPRRPEQLRTTLTGWLADESLRGSLRRSALNRRTMLTDWEQTARVILQSLHKGEPPR